MDMDSAEVQRICQDLVHREVIYNVNYLICEIAKVCNEIPYNPDSDLNSEAVMDLMSARATHLDAINDNSDFMIVEHEGAYYWYESGEPKPFKDVPEGYEVKAVLRKKGNPGWAWRREPASALAGVDNEWSEKFRTREEAIVDAWGDTAPTSFDTEEEAAENCCDENGIDVRDHDREVYEHWIVSGFFARKLQGHGEQVIEFCNLTIWCRCCTGQAIWLDGVIAEIAKDMEILPGMRYDWSKKETP